jgi:O-antigen/teichoic acid export membrane protein
MSLPPAWLAKPIRRLFDNAHIRRVVKNTGYLFGTTGISAGLSIIQGILAARLLGVYGYGLLGSVMMFASVINNFASFRMGELVVKYVGEYSETGDKTHAAAIFKLSALTEMLASIAAFILILLLAPLGARYFAKDALTTNLFVIYGLIVLANLIAESSTGLLQIFDRFRVIAGYNLAQSALTLALTAVVYIMHGNLLGVLVAYLVGKALSALGLTLAALVQATRHWDAGWWRAPLRILRPQYGELIRFAISTNISGSLSLITKDSELLWVSYFRTPLEAGYYKLALSLAYLVQMPVSPMPQTTYPELSRQVARRDWLGVRILLRQGALLAGAYTLAATLGLALIGKPLIRLLYTADFLPAYPALVILLVGYLFANTFYWRRVALLSLGQPGYPAKLNAILAVFKVIGILVLVPRYGYLASAALLTAFYILGSILSVQKTYSLLPAQSEIR